MKLKRVKRFNFNKYDRMVLRQALIALQLIDNDGWPCRQRTRKARLAIMEVLELNSCPIDIFIKAKGKHV